MRGAVLLQQLLLKGEKVVTNFASEKLEEKVFKLLDKCNAVYLSYYCYI